MLLVDVHAHLEHKHFENQLDETIERAKKAGVKVIINNGLNVDSNRKTLEMAKKYDIIKASLGFYPLDAIKLNDEEIEEEITFIEKNKSKIIAIGEIGLDYYFKKDTIERQKVIFAKFLDLAKRLDKPVIVHSREAEETVIEMMEEHGIKKAVMHCFTGKLELAKKCEENGWMLSIPCVLIRNWNFKKIVKEVNISNLLTETDCPYMPCVAKTFSEPAHVITTVEEIAKIKGMDKEEVANNIFMNYQKMFL